MILFNKKINTVEKITARWTDAMKIMGRNKEKIFLIRYEDFVTKQDFFLKALGNGLGVDPRGFNLKTVHDKSIGKYKKYLSAEEISIIEEMAGPLLRSYNYL